jgi:hypothetical protein
MTRIGTVKSISNYFIAIEYKGLIFKKIGIFDTWIEGCPNLISPENTHIGDTVLFEIDFGKWLKTFIKLENKD